MATKQSKCCCPDEEPCPLPEASCSIWVDPEFPDNCYVDWEVSTNTDEAFILQVCEHSAGPISTIFDLTIPGYSGRYGPVDCDCVYWVFAINECGSDSAYCNPPIQCPDCTPCKPANCDPPYPDDGTCGPIQCCNPTEIRITPDCLGLVTIIPDPNKICTDTVEIFRDSAQIIDVEWRWVCDGDTVVYRITYEEHEIISEDPLATLLTCQKVFEARADTCVCPREFQGTIDFVEISSTGTCVCAPLIQPPEADFPEIPEGCCETHYDEETCEFCWECNGVDRVDLVSPFFLRDIGDSGSIFIGDTKLYCIRSYYRNCIEEYCHQNESACCADLECPCGACEDADLDPPLPVACTCFDTNLKKCLPFPPIEVTIAGVVDGANPCLDCDEMNGTFVLGNSTGMACGGTLYEEEDVINDCLNRITVDYPIWVQDVLGDWTCWIKVTMTSKVGPDFIEENSRCDWFTFDYFKSVFEKWTHPSCQPPGTWECFDCDDIRNSVPPLYSTECDSPPSPCVPGNTDCDQHEDPCQLDGATVSVQFLN